eukprot:366298-Chlamydomonas_euryale.AAC.5
MNTRAALQDGTPRTHTEAPATSELPPRVRGHTKVQHEQRLRAHAREKKKHTRMHARRATHLGLAARARGAAAPRRSVRTGSSSATASGRTTRRARGAVSASGRAPGRASACAAAQARRPSRAAGAAVAWVIRRRGRAATTCLAAPPCCSGTAGAHARVALVAPGNRQSQWQASACCELGGDAEREGGGGMCVGARAWRGWRQGTCAWM